MNNSSPDASIDKPNDVLDKETFAWIKSWSNNKIKQWQNVDTDISKFEELKRITTTNHIEVRLQMKVEISNVYGNNRIYWKLKMIFWNTDGITHPMTVFINYL